MLAIPTGTSSALKKISGKESQYMFSQPGTGSDPPIGSDRESGCDKLSIKMFTLSHKEKLGHLCITSKIHTCQMIHGQITPSY